MRGYYYQQREWQGRGEFNKATDLDQLMLTRGGCDLPAMVVGLNGASSGEQVELLEFDDFFNALERRCGRTARLMVENLLSPGGECGERIIKQARQKQEQQRTFKQLGRAERRRQPRGVQKEIRISQRLVRDALGISPGEWARTMNEVRTFTREWVAEQAAA